MATKTSIIKLRSSTTAGAVPTIAQIIAGEPAINVTDKKLFSSDGSVVFQVAPSMAEHALKANSASPALTGTPTAPTAAAGTNTTQIASTAYVRTAIANLIASSPAALDTLNELAAALGDDPNFAATMTTALAGKEAAFDGINGGTF